MSITSTPEINTKGEQILSDINGDEYEEYHNQGNPEDAVYQDAKSANQMTIHNYDEIPASLTDGSNENGDEGVYHNMMM